MTENILTINIKVLKGEGIMKTIFKRSVVLLAVLLLVIAPFDVSAAKIKNPIYKGTVTVDGVIDELWGETDEIMLTLHTAGEESNNASGYAKLMWDNDYIYCLGVVTDSTPTTALRSDNEFWWHDSFEFFIDEANARVDKNSIAQFRVDMFGNISGMLYDTKLDEAGIREEYKNFKGASAKTATGYIVEMAVPWTRTTPKADSSKVGVVFQINDDKDNNGENEGVVLSPVPNKWNPTLYPTYTLSSEKLKVKKEETPSENNSTVSNDNSSADESNGSSDENVTDSSENADGTSSADKPSSDKKENNTSASDDSDKTTQGTSKSTLDPNAFMLMVLGAVIVLCVIGIILVYIFVLRASPKKRK